MHIKYKKAWKQNIIYEIYPRSFKDSNGDGIGDLPGIISKLDYLQSLGVTALWLNPIYQSPDIDHGYDITDYYSIQPEYGTMKDFELLLEEVHKRDMGLIMDLVLNHTSDQHPWFKASRSDKHSRYRDYYIWRPAGADGGPPNNWTSYLGKSAWTFDEENQEFYMHLYNSTQPDLNWDNPDLRESMYKMMRFWLDKGIDGFRIDAVNAISKDQTFPDSDLSRLQSNGEPFIKNGPYIHDYLQEMNEKVFSQYDIFTAGEMSYISEQDVLDYTHPDRKELSMVISPEASTLGNLPEDEFQQKEWSLDDLREVMQKWQKNVGDPGGWFGLYFSNHDQPRLVNTFGNPGEYRVQSAKMIGTMLHTLKGTPFILQGDELGMTNNPKLHSIDDIKEQQALAYYDVMVNERGEDEEKIMQRIRRKARDHARTPMHWDESNHAGFTTGEPWLPANPNYKEVNVKEQESYPYSVLNYYRRLIEIRKNNPVLTYGEYKAILTDHSQIFAYLRLFMDQTWLVLLNFSEEEAAYSLDPNDIERLADARLLIGNYKESNEIIDLKSGNLKPYEAIVLAPPLHFHE
ncbi:alpha-glucosidase [Paenibacillus sp. 453mf]|uniref:glycoside hydrolase family 13 protein n=1 Tax=Paenibacillus sp. 453mf TaxID=1761874 RepID=UPI0008ED27C6|nr:alpha-glucosidase [Paenibacillus sp. 453mf]SFS93926.1 oligo--glucosidase [Paenibacillus sp. 453mf]